MSAKIVVLDAEPVVRQGVVHILKTEGYDVAATDDPEAVLLMIESGPPALIITNVSLPGISGHDAMRMFKKHAPNIPVMMIPGLPDSPVITQWRTQKGFTVFPKPFHATALLDEVRKVLTPAKAAGSSAR